MSMVEENENFAIEAPAISFVNRRAKHKFGHIRVLTI